MTTTTVAVHFDGPIHPPAPRGALHDKPAPGAVQALTRLLAQRPVVVYTDRFPGRVASWLCQQGVPAVAMTPTPTAWEQRGQVLVTGRIVPAAAVIATGAVGHTDWRRTLAALPPARRGAQQGPLADLVDAGARVARGLWAARRA